MMEAKPYGITQGDLDDRRERFDQHIEGILKKSQVENPLVFAAMRAVDRRIFVPQGSKALAYHDRPIPLHSDKTVSSISQPSLVGRMIDNLDPDGTGTVLEIGAASGYNAALLSKCFEEVHTVEYDPGLAQSAAETLRIYGYGNVQVHQGDGAKGLEEYAPYDGIVVTAGLKHVPPAMIEQLKPGGSLVLPAGISPDTQRILKVTNEGDGRIGYADTEGVQFVPVLSEDEGGWSISEIEDYARKYGHLQVVIESIKPYVDLGTAAQVLAILGEREKRNFAQKMFPYHFKEGVE